MGHDEVYHTEVVKVKARLTGFYVNKWEGLSVLYLDVVGCLF